MNLLSLCLKVQKLLALVISLGLNFIIEPLCAHNKILFSSPVNLPQVNSILIQLEDLKGREFFLPFTTVTLNDETQIQS